MPTIATGVAIPAPLSVSDAPGDTSPTPRPPMAANRIEGLFGGEDTFYEALGPAAEQVRTRLATHPDQSRARQGVAITAFLADRTGLSARDVADRYDSLRAAYAKQMFPELKDPLDERGFYNAVVGRLQRERHGRETLGEVDRQLYRAAVAGKDFNTAWSEIAATPAGTIARERYDVNNAWAIDRWEKNRVISERTQFAMESTERLFRLKRAGALDPTLAVEAYPIFEEQAVEHLSNLSDEDRELVLARAWEASQETPQRGRGAVGKGVETILEGTTIALDQALVSLIDTSETLVGLNERQRDAAKPLRTMLQLREMISSEVDPIKGSTFLGQQALNFERELPKLLAARNPAGMALNFFALKRQAREALEQQGADPQMAEGVAALQAIPQTAAYYIGSHLILRGQLPFAANPLNLTARTLAASTGKLFAVETGLNLATNVGANLSSTALQNLGAAVDESIPGVGMKELIDSQVNQSPELITQAIIGGLIGTGVARYRNGFAGAAFLQRTPFMEQLGFRPKDIKAVNEAKTYDQAEAAFQEGYKNRDTTPTEPATLPPSFLDTPATPAPVPPAAKKFEGTVEPLGRRFLVAEGVGEPVPQYQVKLPGETRGRTLTAEQMKAEGIPLPVAPATFDGAQPGKAAQLQDIRNSLESSGDLTPEKAAQLDKRIAEAANEPPIENFTLTEDVPALGKQGIKGNTVTGATLEAAGFELPPRVKTEKPKTQIVMNPDGTYTVQAVEGAPPVKASTPEGAVMVAEAQRTEAAQKAATQPPEPHPENDDGRPLPPRITSLNKENITILRDLFEMDKLDEPTRIKWTQLMDEAKRTGDYKNAEALAADILARGRVASASEHASLLLQAAVLQNQYEQVAAQIADAYVRGDAEGAAAFKRTADNLLAQLDLVTAADDRGGTEVARALSARRMRLNRDDYTLAKTVQRLRTASQRDLSVQEQAELKAITDDYVAQQQVIAEQRNALRAQEVENAKLRAETFVAEGRARRRQAAAASARERRAGYKNELLRLGIRVNDVTSLVPMSGEMGRLIAKIADTYIEEGVASLAELTNKLKADIPDLSDQDVYMAVGRQTQKEAAKIETEAKRRVKELRSQAALWAKINAALDRQTPEGRPLNRKQQHKLLRDSLRELRKQANRTTFDDGALKRIDAKIQEVQRMIATGERNLRTPEKTRPENAELNKARDALKELRQELGALDTIDELESLLGEATAKPAKGEGKPSTVPTEQQAKLRGLRERIKEIRKQLADAKNPPQPEKPSPEQAAAEGELNALARRYSDTQAWPPERDNAVRDIIKAQRESPMPQEEFAATLEAFGVNEATAASLAGAMEIEVRAKETARGLRAIEKDAERTAALEATLADLENQLATGEFRQPEERAKDQDAKRNALRQRIADLREQVAQAQVDPAAVNAERLAKLDRLIAETEAQIEGGFRAIKEPKGGIVDTPEVEATRRELRDLQRLMRTEDSIADLNEQIRTGEYKVSVPEQRILTNARLERALIKQKQLRRQVDEYIERRRKLTPTETIVQTLLVPRTLLATADMSGLLRQGLLLASSRPITATRTFAASFKALFNENTADAIAISIENRPLFLEGERAGLFLSESGSAIKAREEHFLSNFVDRIPGIRRVVRASERSMVTTLNMLRTAAFDGFVKAHPEATFEQKQAYARYVNAASGRGNIKMSAQWAKRLNTVFFAPRYAVSRFETLASPFQNWNDATVRNAILRDFGALIGSGLSVLWLANMAGADVTLDPSDSDFGKIIIDDTRIDIWGGLQQPVRLVLQAAVAGPQRAEMVDLEKEIDPLDAAAQFVKYKLSPAVSVPLALWTGENVIGQEQGAGETLVRAVTPLGVAEGVDVGVQNESVAAGLAAFGASFVGLGVQQHNK